MPDSSTMTDRDENHQNNVERALQDYRPSNSWTKASSSVRYVSELKDNRVFVDVVEADNGVRRAAGAGAGR